MLLSKNSLYTWILSTTILKSYLKPILNKDLTQTRQHNYSGSSLILAFLNNSYVLYTTHLSFAWLHLFRILVNCELRRKYSSLLFIHSSEEQTNDTLLQYVVVILGYCLIIHICGSIYNKHSELFQIFSTPFYLSCYKIRSDLLICTQYLLWFFAHSTCFGFFALDLWKQGICEICESYGLSLNSLKLHIIYYENSVLF